jgi:hypothetical protein
MLFKHNIHKQTIRVNLITILLINVVTMPEEIETNPSYSDDNERIGDATGA